MKQLVKLVSIFLLLLPSLSFSFDNELTCPTIAFIERMGIPVSLFVPGIGTMMRNSSSTLSKDCEFSATINQTGNLIVCKYDTLTYSYRAALNESLTPPQGFEGVHWRGTFDIFSDKTCGPTFSTVTSSFCDQGSCPFSK